MINLTKSYPVPECLAIEKNKPNGTYRCEEVYDLLKKDFHNKCYLCEEKGITSINIEHFKPHKGNRELEFDWDNLFLSCFHCNNTKGDKYNDILNCLDKETKILNIIKFDIKPYPKEKAKISTNSKDLKVKNTVKLLNKIYNGTTFHKRLESSNLRQKLIEELVKFGRVLTEYFDDIVNDLEKEEYLKQIKKMLREDSPFCAFKVYIVLENEFFMKEFKDFISTSIIDLN
ncbi:MAG: HNH endonuclease [Candidatus Sericytochromatia bacterium]